MRKRTRASSSAVPAAATNENIESANEENESEAPLPTAAAVSSRREVQREVAQRRASHFARADPVVSAAANVTSTTSTTPTGIVRLVNTSSAADTAESWPGPFSTARHMIAQRDAARAARLEALEATSSNAAEAEDLDLYDEILQNLSWTPKPAAVTTQQGEFPSLEDLCVGALANYFDSVEDLGEMPNDTMTKLLRVLSVQRKLSSDAIHICMRSTPYNIILPECSNISQEAFIATFAKYRANEIQSLCLFNCGNGFSNETCSELMLRSAAIEILKLTGLFKVTDDCVADLVKKCPKLRVIDFTACARIGDISLGAIAAHQNIVSVTLDSVAHLTDSHLSLLLQSSTTLELLSLNDITALTDESVCSLLEHTGSSLRVFQVTGCALLTDAVLEVIRRKCHVLQTLSIGRTAMTSSGVMALMFRDDEQSAGASIGPLQDVTLSGLPVTDAEIVSLCAYYGSALISLNVSGCAKLTGKSVVALARHCRLLEMLDVSFVRGIKQDALGAFVESNESLKNLYIWGCSQLTRAFFTSCLRPGLMIEGHFNNGCF